MAKPDYDTTLARMAGNIAAGAVDGYRGYFARLTDENAQLAFGQLA